MNSHIILVNNKEYSISSLSKKLLHRRSGWFFSFSFNYFQNERLELSTYINELVVFSQPSLFPLNFYKIETNWDEDNQGSASSYSHAYLADTSLGIKVLSIKFLSYNEVTRCLAIEVNSILCDMYDEFNEKWFDIKIITEIEEYTLAE